jgi:hypothetical protein
MEAHSGLSARIVQEAGTDCSLLNQIHIKSMFQMQGTNRHSMQSIFTRRRVSQAIAEWVQILV